MVDFGESDKMIKINGKVDTKVSVWFIHFSTYFYHIYTHTHTHTNPFAQAGYDARLILKKCLSGLFSGFSFS